MLKQNDFIPAEIRRNRSQQIGRLISKADGGATLDFNFWRQGDGKHSLAINISRSNFGSAMDVLQTAVCGGRSKRRALVPMASCLALWLLMMNLRTSRGSIRFIAGHGKIPPRGAPNRPRAFGRCCQRGPRPESPPDPPRPSAPGPGRRWRRVFVQWSRTIVTKRGGAAQADEAGAILLHCCLLGSGKGS